MKTHNVSDFDAVISDIETDALLDECTLVQCASITDIRTGETLSYRPWEVEAYLEQLSKAKVLINHNWIGFDGPALTKLYGFKWDVRNVFDTLVVSRTLYPDRPQGHSLKSWGITLGLLKGDFGETADWTVFSQEMLDYNIRDNRLTRALAVRQLKQIGWDYRRLIGELGPKT